MPSKKDHLTNDVNITHQALRPEKPQMKEVIWDRAPYSMEFAQFLRGWSLGKYRHSSPFTVRNYKIALKKNKNMYGTAILDSLDMFTEIGQQILHDVTIMLDLITQWRNNMDENPVLFEDVTFSNVSHMIHELDRIIMRGTITSKDINMLFVHYKLHKRDITAKSDTIPNLYNSPLEDISFNSNPLMNDPTSVYETVTWHHWGEERTFLDTSIFRNKVAPRKALDRLIMYGLIDIVEIPRNEVDRGARGRMLAGSAITPTGVRLCELYLDRYGEKPIKRTTPFEPTASFHIDTPKTGPITADSFHRTPLEPIELERVNEVTGATYRVDPKSFRGLEIPPPRGGISEKDPNYVPIESYVPPTIDQLRAMENQDQQQETPGQSLDPQLPSQDQPESIPVSPSRTREDTPTQEQIDRDKAWEGWVDESFFRTFDPNYKDRQEDKINSEPSEQEVTGE